MADVFLLVRCFESAGALAVVDREGFYAKEEVQLVVVLQELLG